MLTARLKFALTALTGFFLLTASAQALTLAEQRQYDKWNEFFTTEGHANDVTKACGVTIPVKLDQGVVTPFMADNKNAASFCDEAYSAIKNTCADNAGKTAVAAKVKSLSCMYSGTKDEASVKLNNGDLQFTFGVDASNLSDKVKTFLGNNL